jgi:hypothetical protein
VESSTGCEGAEQRLVRLEILQSDGNNSTTQYGPTDVADRVAPWRRIFSVKNEPIGFKVLGLRWTTEEAFAAFTSFTFAMVYALARRYMLRYIGE